MAAGLRRPPLTQRVPRPAACSRLPGAELQLVPLPSTQRTHGNDEYLSPASRVDFLPTSSYLLMSGISLHWLESNCWKFGCHGNWSSIHGVVCDSRDELHHPHFPKRQQFSPTSNTFFWIKHLSIQNPIFPCKQSSRRVGILLSDRAWYWPQRRDCQTSSTKAESSNFASHTIVLKSCMRYSLRVERGVTAITNWGWDQQLSVAQSCLTLWDLMDCSPFRLLCPCTSLPSEPLGKPPSPYR